MSKLTEETAQALTDALRAGRKDLSVHLTRLKDLRNKLCALEAHLIEMEDALRAGFAEHKQANAVLSDVINQTMTRKRELEVVQSLINSWES